MKFLVTGAAGFIGSALCRELSVDGNEVIAVDCFSHYYSKNLKELRVRSLVSPHGVKMLDINLGDKQSVIDLFKKHKFDVVVHLAAQPGVRLTIKEMSKYIESNLLGFANVLQLVIENRVPNFLYASSSSVYGRLALTPFNEKDLNLVPQSFYGSTKLANEILTRAAVINSETKARGLRFFSVYGPWGRPDMMYFRLMAGALEESSINFYGDGLIKRDLTYIDDVISNIKNLAKELVGRESGYHDVVNIGNGDPISMGIVLDEIELLTSSKIKYVKMPKNVNDIETTLADRSVLESLVGVTNKTEFKEGIYKFYEWAKSTEIRKHLDTWIQSVN
jgi:UDP-glucuronate 4-epimerase